MSKSIGYPKKRKGGFKHHDKDLVRGKNTKKDMAQNKHIMKIEKKLSQLEKAPELKWVDEYNAGQLIDNVGQVYNPFTPNPIIGAGPNNRIGNSIMMTSLHWHILIRTNASNLDEMRLRVLVVVDKEFSGGNPTLAGNPSLGNPILDNFTITDATIAPRNFNEVNRFTIKYDKIFTINSQVVADYDPVSGNTSTVVPMGKHIRIDLKMRHKIQFRSANSPVTDLLGTIPLLYLVSDRPTAGIQPLATVGTRVYYKDA